jgi:hypothetical protein
MNNLKTNILLVLFALTAMAVLMGVQEYRFQLKLDALRAEVAAANAASVQADASAEEGREAIRQMSRAREELAAAQQRLARATQQIQQLQAQAQSPYSPDRTTRLPRRSAPVFTDDMGFNPGFESTQRDPTLPVRRSWGQEQATGAPDTMQAGDISTAWAPREQDGGEEWLHLDYSNQVQLAEVRVRETHNPGAISKVTAMLPNGQEVVLWEGVDQPGVAPVEKSFPVNGNITAASVKVYLDTKRIPGWNEIDAVELVGRDGSRQWASQARASSSYADPR